MIDVKPYASDMECFVPLMEKFNKSYGHYPKYPVADAGYGSYNKQAERTFGILKWDKSYKRLFRRGQKNVNLELLLIFCGFNIYKYYNKKQRKQLAA